MNQAQVIKFLHLRFLVTKYLAIQQIYLDIEYEQVYLDHKSLDDLHLNLGLMDQLLKNQFDKRVNLNFIVHSLIVKLFYYNNMYIKSN